MTRFVVGEDRNQSTLFPELLDDYVGDDNPARAIDFFVDELDLGELGFGGSQPRPSRTAGRTMARRSGGPAASSSLCADGWVCSPMPSPPSTAASSRRGTPTKASIQRRMEQVEASIERYMAALETADRQDGEVAPANSVRLKDKIAALKAQMQAFKAMEAEVHAAPDQQISLTDPDARAMGTSGKGTGMVG